MLEEMRKMIAEQLNCEESEITADTSFKDDLGADSLDLFEMVMAFEEAFEVEIPSEDLEQIIHHYKDETDRKYNKIVTHFPRALTHPKRNRETELGNLFADLFVKSLGIDLMLVGSGSIRKTVLGPGVRLGDLKVIFPFEDEIMGIVWTGAQLRRAMQFVLRDEMFSDETEFYQVSKALKLTYDAQTKQFTEFTMYGKPVADDAKFRIGFPLFQYGRLFRHQSGGNARQ